MRFRVKNYHRREGNQNWCPSMVMCCLRSPNSMLSVYFVRLCIWVENRKPKTINKFRHYIHNKNKLSGHIHRFKFQVKRKLKKWRNEEWTKVKINTQKLTHALIMILFSWFIFICFIFLMMPNILSQTNQNERTHTQKGTDRTKQHEMMKLFEKIRAQ